MSYIGIDLGTSNTKIIEVDEKLNLIHKIILNKMEFKEALGQFINKYNINIKNINKIIVTGVDSNKIPQNILNTQIIRVPEFNAIANAGKINCNEENYIVASVGTGTAFVKNKNGEITHIGGSGVGGGTLINLSKKISPNINFDKIDEAIKEGNLENVDLKIHDVTTEEIITLPKDITAVNFGKLNNNASEKDIILGIVNMIFEIVGVMGAFIAKGADISKIIVIGQIATIPYARVVLDKIEKLHGVKFIIPENAQYGTALGAVNYVIARY